MLNIEPTGQVLGATVTGADLRRPLSRQDFGQLLKAVGTHGVLRFPAQSISATELKDFAERFGELQR